MEMDKSAEYQAAPLAKAVREVLQKTVTIEL